MSLFLQVRVQQHLPKFWPGVGLSTFMILYMAFESLAFLVPAFNWHLRHFVMATCKQTTLHQDLTHWRECGGNSLVKLSCSCWNLCRMASFPWHESGLITCMEHRDRYPKSSPGPSVFSGIFTLSAWKYILICTTWPQLWHGFHQRMQSPWFRVIVSTYNMLLRVASDFTTPLGKATFVTTLGMIDCNAWTLQSWFAFMCVCVHCRRATRTKQAAGV